MAWIDKYPMLWSGGLKWSNGRYFFLVRRLVRWWLITLYFSVCVVRPTYCFVCFLHVIRKIHEAKRTNKRRSVE